MAWVQRSRTGREPGWDLGSRLSLLAAPNLTPRNIVRGGDKTFANIPFCQKLSSGEGRFLVKYNLPGGTGKGDRGGTHITDGREGVIGG